MEAQSLCILQWFGCLDIRWRTGAAVGALTCAIVVQRLKDSAEIQRSGGPVYRLGVTCTDIGARARPRACG